MAIDPLLSTIKDPTIFLQIYARQYRTGSLPHQWKAVRAPTVKDALRSIGQAFASVGAPDPRKDAIGKIDFRLTRQLRSYDRSDPPPGRVKPIPFSVVSRIAMVASTSDSDSINAISDMVILAFFFLLRPGEYTANTSDTEPFRLEDVRVRSGGIYLDIENCSFAELDSADFVTLIFTTQKNGVKGEVIGHGRSAHYLCCPVGAVIRRIKHLRTHNAPLNTPLSMFFDSEKSKWRPVLPKDITTTLRQAVTFIGPQSLGFLPKDIEARSLRAGGAMALLCGNVDKEKIQLLGRWRSDAMLRYLHVQAQPFMFKFAELMVNNGDFTLLPNTQVPQLA